MKKYLLLLTMINAVLGSWSSDDLSDDPWAFGKPMPAEESLKLTADQENVEPCSVGQAIKSTDILRRTLTKSKTSLNLLADAELASKSLSGSFEKLVNMSNVFIPQHDRYTKYYHNITFFYLGAAGEILKLRISRDMPCVRTGEVFPATCRLTFKDRGFTERTPTVFTQQSFEGPHDSYEVPIDGVLYNKFVVKIPTLVENLIDKTKDKLPAQLIFHKPDGQVKELPLELESLTFNKP